MLFVEKTDLVTPPGFGQNKVGAAVQTAVLTPVGISRKAILFAAQPQFSLTSLLWIIVKSLLVYSAAVAAPYFYHMSFLCELA